MNPLLIATIVRFIMAAAGTWTGNEGWNNEETIQLVLGGVLALGALVWGIVEKRSLAKKGIVSTKGREPEARTRSDDIDPGRSSIDP